MLFTCHILVSNCWILSLGTPQDSNLESHSSCTMVTVIWGWKMIKTSWILGKIINNWPDIIHLGAYIAALHLVLNREGGISFSLQLLGKYSHFPLGNVIFSDGLIGIDASSFPIIYPVYNFILACPEAKSEVVVQVWQIAVVVHFLTIMWGVFVLFLFFVFLHSYRTKTTTKTVATLTTPSRNLV